MSWNEAVAYCNALSHKEKLGACYKDGDKDYDMSSAHAGRTPQWPMGLKCEGYRLPTEAEWENAARAGTTTAYFTGNTLEDLDRAGWYGSNSGGTPHAVGDKQKNAWGLYDMHGNVWEWVWDWYAEYGSGSATDPVGPGPGSFRVIRGGSWLVNAWSCRSANRSYVAPGYREVSLGFRPARSVP